MDLSYVHKGYVHMFPGGNTDARNMLFYNSSSTKNQISNFHKWKFRLSREDVHRYGYLSELATIIYVYCVGTSVLRVKTMLLLINMQITFVYCQASQQLQLSRGYQIKYKSSTGQLQITSFRPNNNVVNYCWKRSIEVKVAGCCCLRSYYELAEDSILSSYFGLLNSLCFIFLFLLVPYSSILHE